MPTTTLRYDFVDTVSPNILIDLYQAGGWWRELPQSRRNLPALVKGSFCFLLVTDGDKPVGMGRVISDGVSDGYIHDVIVKKEYRNRGIGKEIIRRLRDYCLEKNLEWIALITSDELTAFYESVGFKAQDHHTSLLLLAP